VYPGLLGFREVAGLPTADGGTVRPGLLYRSGTPQFLDEDGARALLADTGIRGTVDLRLPHEIDVEGRGPLDRLGVAHVRNPFVIRGLVAAGSAVAPMSGPDPLVANYLRYLDNGLGAVAGVVTALAAPGALPALVHCTVGKDRTGVAIALVLGALGVSHADVAAEYARGQDDVGAAMARLRTMASYRDAVDVYPPEAYRADPGVMLRFLAAVDERHGGVRGLLTAGGADPAALDRLTDRLVEPARPEHLQRSTP
jgi:protein-tyrosine phosphatase